MTVELKPLADQFRKILDGRCWTCRTYGQKVASGRHLRTQPATRSLRMTFGFDPSSSDCRARAIKRLKTVGGAITWELSPSVSVWVRRCVCVTGTEGRAGGGGESV